MIIKHWKVLDLEKLCLYKYLGMCHIIYQKNVKCTYQVQGLNIITVSEKVFHLKPETRINLTNLGSEIH